MKSLGPLSFDELLRTAASYAAGETVGVNFDSSHLKWMGAAPLAAIAPLGSSVYHARQGHAPQIAAADARRPLRRHRDSAGRGCRASAWNYVTLSRVTMKPSGAVSVGLATIGYDDVTSIEHGDSHCRRSTGSRNRWPCCVGP